MYEDGNEALYNHARKFLKESNITTLSALVIVSEAYLNVLSIYQQVVMDKMSVEKMKEIIVNDWDGYGLGYTLVLCLNIMNHQETLDEIKEIKEKKR